MSGPRHCRSAALEFFQAQLSSIEQTDSLCRAAIAVAMHELQDVDPAACETILDSLASEVQSRVRSQSQQAIVSRLHEVLFDEQGFTGNVDNYYSAGNSYLPRVLETRKGIPVTLSLVYKSVAQRLGLTVRGINAPAHFLASVEVDGSWMMIDPFDGGRVLAPDEAFERLEKAAGGKIARHDAFLSTATHAEWLARIIRNLALIFQREGRETDQLAMDELLSLLPREG